MNPEQHQLLTLAVLPARSSAEHAAQFLGFQSYELTVLMAAGLLRPVGRPAGNSPTYFAAVELEQLRRDTKWLSKATDAIQHRWRHKNHTALVARPRVKERQRLRATPAGAGHPVG